MMKASILSLLSDGDGGTHLCGRSRLCTPIRRIGGIQHRQESSSVMLFRGAKEAPNTAPGGGSSSSSLHRECCSRGSTRTQLHNYATPWGAGNVRRIVQNQWKNAAYSPHFYWQTHCCNVKANDMQETPPTHTKQSDCWTNQDSKGSTQM